jgi:hypothetical protein
MVGKIDRRMINCETTLIYHFFEVAITYVAQHHTATPGKRIVGRLPLEALMAELLINILDPVSE